MKKLMILAAMICAAIGVQAAAFDWKTSTTGKIYAPGTTTTISGTAYLFDALAVSQADILADFASGGITFSDALNNKTVTNGAIASTTGGSFTWGNAGDTLNAFVVLVDNDMVFISGSMSATALETGTASMSFNLKNASQAAAFTDASSYQGAGWYTAVPEPTSGLLLLLGMAGLALKRKQA